MVDNQHRKIVGYRDLTEEDIASMNRIKQLGKLIEAEIDLMPGDADPRWKAEGRTDLQKGLMSLTRAIAKPDFF